MLRRLLFLGFLSCSLCAQDIRDKVAAPVVRESINDTIDPDAHVFGIPYGITEDQFISQYGNPMGYLRLSANESGMCYGRKYCFLFTGGKLSGIRITSNVLDWKLSQLMAGQTVFDAWKKWRLPNGVSEDMTRTEVKRILGDQLNVDRYNCHFETSRARVELDFSHRVDAGENDDAFRLFGIFVRPR